MKFGAIVLIFFSCIAVTLSAFNLFLTYTHPLKYENVVIEGAKKYDLSPSLLASLINVESSFKPNVKSNKNAIGLMQIKLSTANYLDDLNGNEHVSETSLFEVKTNINYGCEYLNYLMKKFKDVNTTLAAYNAGETIVRSWLNSGIYSTDKITLSYIPYEETRNYIKKINKNIKFYNKYFN